MRGEILGDLLLQKEEFQVEEAASCCFSAVTDFVSLTFCVLSCKGYLFVLAKICQRGRLKAPLFWLALILVKQTDWNMLDKMF